VKLSRWAKIAAPIVFGATIALTIPTLAAVGQNSPPGNAVAFAGNATLVAKGLQVTVPVQITCPAGIGGQINVNLSERSGKAIAQGYGYSQVGCTGQPETLLLTVNAQNVVFKPGTALASASLYAFCFSGECNASATQSIRIAN